MAEDSISLAEKTTPKTQCFYFEQKHITQFVPTDALLVDRHGFILDCREIVNMQIRAIAAWLANSAMTFRNSQMQNVDCLHCISTNDMLIRI